MTATPHADAFLAVARSASEPARLALERALVALAARADVLATEAGLAAVASPTLAVSLARSDALRGAVTRGEPVRDDALGECVLAASARAGSAKALARFDALHIAPLDRALAHMKLDRATLDEVRQRVREKLLLPVDGGGIRLEQYAGQGRLAGLVRVAASRAALDILRGAPGRQGALRHGELDLLGADGDAVERRDPALAALARRCRAEFSAAFAEAVRGLDPRARNVLRLHLLRGVSLEQLAAMYQVHRATTVRWLADARRTLLAATRKGMQARLGVRASEVDSLLGLIESQLDVSVERLLRSEEDAGALDP